LFEVNFSFATHTTNEKVTFKLIAQTILLILGDVVLDKHQFTAIIIQLFQVLPSLSFLFNDDRVLTVVVS